MCLVIVGTLFLSSHYRFNENCTLQFGFCFLLLHSLRWNDKAHPGARVARISASLFWALHSFLLIRSSADFQWVPISLGVSFVLLFVVVTFLLKHPFPGVILGACLIVLLSTPINMIAPKVVRLPLGVVVTLGSFVLFALATGLALRKSKFVPEISPQSHD
jgi:hypothetical protein